MRRPISSLSEVGKQDYDILHFIGTAIPTSEVEPSEATQALGLILMPPDGKRPETHFAASQIVTPTTLIKVLSSHPSVRLVMLDACYSQALAFRLAQSLPAVLGYRDILTLPACETFVEGFYRSLFVGQPLEVAVTDARQRIDRLIPGSREWGQVVLYLQTEEWPDYSVQEGESAPKDSWCCPTWMLREVTVASSFA